MNIRKKISDLENARFKITEEIEKLRKITADSRYSKMTIDEIKDEWNESSEDEREAMVEDIPEFYSRLGSNEGYEETGYSEADDNARFAFESKWDDVTDVIDLEGVFSEYCK